MSDTIVSVDNFPAVQAVSVAQLPASLTVSGGLQVDGSATVQPVQVVAGDVDHGAINTLKVLQVGGHSSPSDTFPPTVSAAGIRVRLWLDQNGRVIVGSRKVVTFSAALRGTSMAPMSTSLVANSPKQLATIYHGLTDTKKVEIKRAVLNLLSSSAACDITFELHRLSSQVAPSGGGIIHGAPHDPTDGDPVTKDCQSTIKIIPSTPGSDPFPDRPLAAASFLTVGASPTGAVMTPYLPPTHIVLWNSQGLFSEVKDPIIRPTQAEGWAIIVNASANTTIKWAGELVFTEVDIANE